MNIQNKNLFIIIFLTVLISACSNQPKVISATEDTVVVKAPANNFIEAYDLAKKECQKHTTSIEYSTNEEGPLEELAFNCTGEKIEPVAEAPQEATTPVEEVQTEVEAVPEEEVETVIEEESTQEN